MKKKYRIVYYKSFKKLLGKFLDSGRITQNLVTKVIDKLKEDPFNPSLKTHKVNSKKFGTAWSTKLNSDLRIIWKFDNNKITILLLDIGGHSGSRKVYK